MQARAALGACLAAAALAVAIVAVDLAWNTEVRLDMFEDGQWQTVATDDGEGFYGRPYDPFECETVGVSGMMRVVVDNDEPFGKTLDIVVATTNATDARQVLVDETWELGAFDSRMAEFMVEPADPAPGSPRDPCYGAGSITVQAGDVFLSVPWEAAP